MISETSSLAVRSFVFMAMWGRRMLMAAIRASHSGMLRLFDFCLRFRYASCSQSAVGPRTNLVRAQTSVRNVVQVAFTPAVHKLLNFVLAVDQMQSRRDVIVELILAGSVMRG